MGWVTLSQCRRSQNKAIGDLAQRAEIVRVLYPLLDGRGQSRQKLLQTQLREKVSSHGSAVNQS